MVSVLTFKSLIRFNVIFISGVCKVGVQFHSFSCEYPVFSTPFIEERLSFPH